ncbi:substrate-binding domain-containing protein [Methanoculleus sp.]|uniref:substrate-binding domain-containing protein n=1 Tax=Methanoculleus sp. TaxID=90427 RepID=UPI0025DE33B5|nr:substrate-binding domain-containing protein [Methanoculleus sp.]
MNFKNMNESAVSPIVATLVLIVVAVVGAVAVGTIMGAFSSDVSEQMNTGDVSGSTASEILIAGSTTVYPASVELAQAYMASHPGIKVTVQGGGSGAGVAAAGMGVADIGASSSESKITDKINDGTYPNMQLWKIGGSAVCFVASGFEAGTSIDLDAIEKFYVNANTDGKVNVTAAAVAAKVITADSVLDPDAGTPTDIQVTVYQRGDDSGTEETVAEATTTYKSAKSLDASNALEVTGNPAMLTSVEGSTAAFGFVDYGFTTDTSAIVLSVDGQEPSSNNIKSTLKGTEKYPEKLCRGLYYAVNGNPTSVVKNFIDFAMSPGSIDCFDDAGMFSIMEIS